MHKKSSPNGAVGVLALLAAVVVNLAGGESWAAVMPLTADQMVRLSQQVVVVFVEGQQAHWNEQHTLIVTDYFLRVESRLRGEAKERVTLTMPGGTVGGESHDTSVSIQLHVGDRYLLFCRDLAQSHMTPITGAWQGAFREVIEAGGEGVVAPGGGGVPLASSGRTVHFSEFVEAVRELVRQAPAEPLSESVPGWSAQAQSLPAKVYAPLAPLPDVHLIRTPGILAALTPAVAGGPGTAVPLLLPPQDTTASEALDLNGNIGKYVWQRRPDPPVVFNQLPSSFAPWSPEDQTMMGYWNIYASSLFRVYVSPTGTWSWGNGINDIAGFPSDADMVSQFGPGAAWGPDTLAVTYSRWNGSGPIIESDIALNPHFPWTTDEALATQAASPAWSFRQAVLHELGHSWGLQHPWESQRVWWDSVMNYAPKNFRFTKLFSDDTAAVRSAYPGGAIHDGLLSAYQTDYGLSGNAAAYTDSQPTSTFLSAGASFQMSQAITIENVGTDDLVNPTIEVYLTPQRISFAHSIYMTTVHFIDTVHPFPNFSVHRLGLGSLTVPINTPTGQYAVAFFLRDDADGLQYNNSAWTDAFIQVQGDPTRSCSPGAKTLCIDDQPGDQRFKIEIQFSTRSGGGFSGSATAIPLASLGVVRGGLFWFFSADNPEMLIKVLNGCPVNGNYWVFSSAGTNVGLAITVTDTQTGRQRSYANADGTAAVPILDTGAFACSIR